MNIGFILNGEDVSIRSEPNVRLIDILRMKFGLLGAKIGCLSGKCGFCSVIFNGKVSNACLIPAFKVRGSEIITIEGFLQTDEYKDIMTGFSQAQLINCGYCETSKILITEAFLEKVKRPSRQEILNAFNGIKCRCIDPDQLATGVEKAADVRRRRLYGRSV